MELTSLAKPEPRGPKPPSRIKPKCGCSHRFDQHDDGGRCMYNHALYPQVMYCACDRFALDRPASSSVRRSAPKLVHKYNRQPPKPRCKVCGHQYSKHSYGAAPGKPACLRCVSCPGYEPARRGSLASRRTPLATLRRTLWDTFRVYVYERDGDACISCGKAGLVGSDRQAGHLFNAGTSSLIRWHPKNVHVQCYRCNVGLRGNIAPYALEFITRYGGDELQRLGRMSKVIKKWTAPEVSELIAALKRGGADYETFYAETCDIG